jgi:hypothetical protein
MFWLGWPRLFMSAPEPTANSVESTSEASTVLGSVLAPYIGIRNDFMGIICSLQFIAHEDIFWAMT